MVIVLLKKRRIVSSPEYATSRLNQDDLIVIIHNSIEYLIGQLLKLILVYQEISPRLLVKGLFTQKIKNTIE